jgi:oxygen-independent coproporphyrinogen-3 oxidase
MTELACKENHDELSSRPRDERRARALYVHVPFCRRKCAYCDFASHVPSAGEEDRWLAALRTELTARRDDLYAPLSCYVGGGTPTALPARVLRDLLATLRPLLADDAEFSVETNPATVDEAIAAVLVDGGVNRATLGAQSFRAAELRTLGRLHGPDDTARAAEALRRAGLTNLAVDLIYAVPGQSPASWLASLRAAIRLQPRHVSCYALSFEDGTPLATDLEAGRVAELDDETQRRMYDLAVDELTAAGYEHYELSNFAQPGKPCRQNLVYWRNESYLGVGPAACSYVDGRRRGNTRDFAAWAAALEQTPPQPPPAEAERLPLREAMAEALMLALRLTAGVDEQAFARRYGQRPADAFPASIGRQLDLGALKRSDGRLSLARGAYFTSDSVLADIIAEASPRARG